MIKVHLRRKKISDGRTSLYLDYYPAIPHPDTGKNTRREFLGLYVFNRPKTPADKDQNAETIALGENIRAKRQIEVQNGAYGFLCKKNLNTCFVEYCEQLATKRTGSTRDGWDSFLHYLRDFTGGSLKLSHLNLKKCRDFREFMLNAPSKRNGKPLAVNSIVNYFNKFKAALNQAYKDELISTDMNGRLECIKPEETFKDYLTVDELKRLNEIELSSFPILKQAAFFSALTGLRHSDIKNMVWGQIHFDENEGHEYVFRQQKTRDVEYMPIPKFAMSYLGERQEDDKLVFPDLRYSAHWNKKLKQWIKDAKITKTIKFHNFRHTFATLQLASGTEFLTISELLGNRSLKTSKIYTKVERKAKREAVNKIIF